MRTRFAPSPTGLLHLGHAYSALTAWDRCRAAGGTFLLRIEDIDTARARPAFERAIYEDLAWLGLSWPEPVMRQSTRMPAYAAALARLAAAGLVYPCRCTRGDVRRALDAPQDGEVLASGPDGPLYPGTCRSRAVAGRTPADALRLDMRRAIAHLGGAAAVARLGFTERGDGLTGRHRLDAEALIGTCGDIVLARRDIATSYHLAVVVDDAHQGITEIIRGRDLFEATKIHVLLQSLLEYSTPTYYHHSIVKDSQNKRLAKRDDARAIRAYRDDGKSPRDIRRMTGLAEAPITSARTRRE